MVVHAIHGDYAADLPLVFLAAAGALVGGTIGARLSPFVSARTLRSILAATLALVGLRMVF